VVWTIKGDAEGHYHLTTAATDGFRLSVADTNSLPPTAPVRCLIPGKALIELGKLLKDDSTEVLFAASLNRNQVMFSVDNVTIVSQLIDGNYPSYEQIIPKSYSTLIAADRGMLQRTVKRAALFARDGANIIRFKVEPPSAGMDFGLLHITADSTEYGDTSGQVDVVVEGPATEIAFNAKYLSDALGAIKTEQVRIELLSAASPGVFKPSDGNFTHVVMPMHIGR
jgi:DNA polymerase-3 subunit beta